MPIRRAFLTANQFVHPAGACNPIAREWIVNRDDLAQAIIDLENDRGNPIGDEQLAYDLGYHVKPVVDQLTQAQGAATALSAAAANAGSTQDRAERLRRATRKAPRFDGPAPELSSLEPQEKARWIFMERFIPLEQNEEILGCPFTGEEYAAYLSALGHYIDKLFLIADVAKALEQHDLTALQKRFASTILLFRHAQIGDGMNSRLPCNLENLRERFGAYFYKRRTVPNWYEAQPFYTDALAQSRWVLCELDYLNCTLRQPQKRLLSYAHSWALNDSAAAQKTVLEDIYDRILCGEALKEHRFEQNCNSCTSTRYRKGQGMVHQVYTVQKNQKIAIHGKVGLPHWRRSRRLWPGLYPTLVL